MVIPLHSMPSSGCHGLSGNVNMGKGMDIHPIKDHRGYRHVLAYLVTYVQTPRYPVDSKLPQCMAVIPLQQVHSKSKGTLPCLY